MATRTFGQGPFHAWLEEAVLRTHGGEYVKPSVGKAQAYQTLIQAVINRLVHLDNKAAAGEYADDQIVCLFCRLADNIMADQRFGLGTFDGWLEEAVLRSHGGELIRMSLSRERTYKDLLQAVIDRLVHLDNVAADDYAQDKIVLLFRELADVVWHLRDISEQGSFGAWLVEAVLRSHGHEKVTTSAAKSQSYKTMVQAVVRRLVLLDNVTAVDWDDDRVVFLFGRQADTVWLQIEQDSAKS